jgi:hypothetical protein
MDSILNPSTFLWTLAWVGASSALVLALYPQAKAKFKMIYDDNEENRRRIDKCPTIKRVTPENFKLKHLGLFLPNILSSKWIVAGCIWEQIQTP